MAACVGHSPLFCSFRSRKDSLEMYTNAELLNRYIIDQQDIEYMTELVRRDSQNTTTRPKHIVRNYSFTKYIDL